MRSKFLMRLLAAGASAAAVLGGGTFALASDSPASASTAGTTYYACVVTGGNHALFPWHSLWKTSTSPVTCPEGSFSISWNQRGPQGPAGTLGSLTTFNHSFATANDTTANLIFACDNGGMPVSGGVSLDLPVIGVTLLSDRPDPPTGAPTGWDAAIANASGLTVTMTVYIVCTTPAATSSGAGAAPHAQGARIVKETVTRLRNPAKP